MDGPVKMNTEWSVWPVHVLGPVGPAFFNFALLLIKMSSNFSCSYMAMGSLAYILVVFKMADVTKN
jgi:hypothetical protein